MKLKPICLTAVTIVLLLGTGCASIVSRTSREINLRSTPPNAVVQITDEKGKSIFEGETPTIVTLKTGKPYGVKKYMITFKKDGFQPITRIVRSTINGWYFGNLVFGGLVGVVVDPLTGAMWTLSPNQVDVNLLPVGSVSGEAPALNVVHLDDVPRSLRASMLPLE